MIPKNATEPALAKQTYVAVTRPKKKSRDFSDRSLLASNSSLHNSSGRNRKSKNISLVQGEIILAIPRGFSHLEIVRLGKKILANPRIQKLLEKSNPLAPSKKKTKSCKIKNSNHKASNSVHSLEKVVEEDEEDSLLGASPMKKTSYWLSKPGSLDAFLDTTANGSSRNGDKRDDHESADKGRRSSHYSAGFLSPGSATSSQHLLDAYLSDSSLRKRRAIKARKQREQQQRKLEAGFASPTMSSVRNNRYPDGSSVASQGTESTAACSGLGDYDQRVAAAAKNALGPMHHHHRVGGGDNSSVVTDASHSTCWSNHSTASQQQRRVHRYGSTSSFASLGTSTRSRTVTDNTAARFLVQRRNKNLRMKKRLVSVAKLVAALLLTMAVRFYLDPNGYSALMKARRTDSDDEDSSRFHNQPLGILGALQLLLFFNLLVKLQGALDEGFRSC